MATTRKKTTAGARARSGAKTTGSRSASTRSRAAAKNTKRPIRREVGGVVMLLAALIVLVSYFTGEGWLIDLIPKAFKGLFGVGYYLMVPAFLAAAWVLLTHRGRPVALRTACALLTPYLFGGVCHMLFCKLDLSDAAKLFPTLWETGYTLESGGVLSGGTAHGFMAVLGKPASVIVFIVLLAALLMVVAQVTPAMLIELWQEREDYDEEDYPEPPPPPPKRQTQAKRQAQQSQQAARARAMIDIPLDGTPLGAPAPASKIDIPLDMPQEKKSFFRPREKEQLTPADVLSAHASEPPVPEPVPVSEPDPVREPDPEPIPELDPLVEPVSESEPEPIPEPEPEPEPVPPPAPAPVVEERRKKKNAAEILEEATAQVTAEIANTMASGSDHYAYPPVTLLEENLQDNYIEAGAELRSTSQRLADTLRSFGPGGKTQ